MKGPGELFDEAIAAEDDGDFDHAIACYDVIVAADERYPDALYNRGVARFRKNELEAAAADFERAAALFPDNPSAPYNLGVCLGRLADRAGLLVVEGQDGTTLRSGPGIALLQRAREAYTRAIEIDPQGHRLVNRAVVLRKLGLHEAAIADAERAAAMGEPVARRFLRNEYGRDVP